MRHIVLFRGEVAIVDDDDFERINKNRWHMSQQGYAVRSGPRGVGRKQDKIRMHRVIMNSSASEVYDHINGNRLDNSKSNLRLCSPSQNSQNKKIQSGKELKGTSFRHRDGKWISSIYVNRKPLFLGAYVDAVTAAAIYDLAARKYFGEFARTNFPPRQPRTAQ